MHNLWSFLSQKRDRAVLGWIGGGIVAVAAGAWAVLVFFLTPSPPPSDDQTPDVEAHSGGVAIGGDVIDFEG